MFGDRLQQKEEVNILLECGHPNTAEGDRCELCGKVLETITAEQVGSIEDVLGDLNEDVIK